MIFDISDILSAPCLPCALRDHRERTDAVVESAAEGRPMRKINEDCLRMNGSSGTGDAYKGIGATKERRVVASDHFQKLEFLDTLAEKTGSLCRMAHKAWRNN